MQRYRGLLAGLALGLLLGTGGQLFGGQVASFPSTEAALRSIYNRLDAGLSVTGSTSAQPQSVAITQITPTLSAGIDATIVADATTTPRKHISIMNISTGAVSLNFGSAATAGQGITLGPAAADGGQGGGYSFDGMTVPSNAIHAISAAGTRLAVIVGN